MISDKMDQHSHEVRLLYSVASQHRISLTEHGQADAKVQKEKVKH